jgi:hypothetical protein
MHHFETEMDRHCFALGDIAMSVRALPLDSNFAASRATAASRSRRAFPGVIVGEGINRRYGRSIRRGPLVGVFLGKALPVAIVATCLSLWLLIHFHS